MMGFSKWSDVYSERARQFDNPLDVCEFYSGEGYYGDDWFRGTSDSVSHSLHLQPADRVLEVGCGCGLIMKHLLPRAKEFVGVDLSEEVLDIARRALPSVEFINATAANLPFDDGSFDKCYCYQSMHYFDDHEIAKQAIVEMGRVVRPDGRILIGQVPNAELEEEYQRLRRTRKFQRDNRVEHDLCWLWFSPQFFFEFRDRFHSVEIQRIERPTDATSKYRMDVIITV